MRNKKGSGEFLAFLTVKYDIHPDMLFCALLAAGEIGKAKCGSISIECRGKVDNKIYYLIKEGSRVVGQFPISEDLLASKRNPVRDFMETDMVKNWNPQGPQKRVYCSIRDLKAGNRHVNLVADVTDVSKPMKVSTQFGNMLLLAKALLKDDTGEISLCLWKDQVESVSVGNRVEIRDASVRKFRGKIQLGLGKKGTLKIASDLAV